MKLIFNFLLLLLISQTAKAEWGGWTRDVYEGLQRGVEQGIDRRESGVPARPDYGSEGGTTTRRSVSKEIVSGPVTRAEALAMAEKYFTSFRCEEENSDLDGTSYVLSFLPRDKKNPALKIYKYFNYAVRDKEGVFWGYNNSNQPYYIKLDKKAIEAARAYFGCYCDKYKRNPYYGEIPFCKDPLPLVVHDKTVNQGKREPKPKEVPVKEESKTSTLPK